MVHAPEAFSLCERYTCDQQTLFIIRGVHISEGLKMEDFPVAVSVYTQYRHLLFACFHIGVQKRKSFHLVFLRIGKTLHLYTHSILLYNNYYRYLCYVYMYGLIGATIVYFHYSTLIYKEIHAQQYIWSTVWFSYLLIALRR